MIACLFCSASACAYLLSIIRFVLCFVGFLYILRRTMIMRNVTFFLLHFILFYSIQFSTQKKKNTNNNNNNNNNTPLKAHLLVLSRFSVITFVHVHITLHRQHFYPENKIIWNLTHKKNVRRRMKNINVEKKTRMLHTKDKIRSF